MAGTVRDLITRLVTTGADQAVRDLDRVADKADDLEHANPTVDVDADTTKATGVLGKFGDKLKGIGGIGKTAFGALETYGPQAALAAGTAVAGFVTNAVGDFQTLALEVGKARDSLGLTAEDASRLKEVGEDVGVGFDTLQGAIGRMNKTAGTTPAAFEGIGASIAKSDDGATDVTETFLNTIDALNRIPDAATRAAAAQKIFGKGWTQIAELVEQGADGVRQAMADVESGKVVSDEQVDQSRELRDGIDALKGAFESFAGEVGSSVIPVLNDMIGALGKIQGAIDAIPGKDLAGKFWSWTNPIGLSTKALGKANDVMDDLTGTVHGSVGVIETQTAAAEDAAVAADELAAAQTAVDDAVKATVDGYGAYADKLRELIDLHAEMIDGQHAAADAQFAVRDAQRDLNESMRDYRKLTKDADATQADLAEALDDSAQSAGKLADAQVDVARETAKANGTTLSAKQAQSTWNSSMVASAAQARGPLRDAIIQYIAAVNDIPPQKVAKILADPDNQSIDAASRAIDAAADKHRDAEITAYASTGDAEADLAALARDRYVQYYAVTHPANVNPGGASSSSTTTRSSRGRAAPAAAAAVPVGGGGGSTSITIQAAVIGNRYDVQRVVRQSLRDSVRINGARPYR